jgi:hypothetical protein
VRAVNGLTEWLVERSLRRATRAAERFEDFGHLRRPGPAFVSSRPPDTASTSNADADRIDAGRPPGCGRMLAGLAAVSLTTATAVVGIVYALALLAGR